MKLLLNQVVAASLLVGSLFVTSCGEKSVEKDQVEHSAEEVKPYPLDVCLVSGEELGSMGEPHVFVHEGQQIKMCCDSCVPKFEKDPEKYLSKLEEAKS